MKMTKQIRSHMVARGDISKRNILLANFIGGIAWGLGTVVGATVIVALLLWILSFFNYIPVIGNFASTIENSVSPQRIQQEKIKNAED